MTEPDRITVTTLTGAEVGALLLRPADPSALLVLGHGAGAGMEHPFMEGVATRLADRGVATLRYQFPYMHAGKKSPDRAPVLVSAVRGAVRRARELAEGLPLFAGGKSLGGRMTSLGAAEAGWRGEPGGAHDLAEAERAVHGIVFFGFPLHAAGAPSAERAAHLERVKMPLLFLQGTRDSLATLELLRPVLTALGPQATLHVVDGADHGFHVRGAGKSDPEVLDELADETVAWMKRVMGSVRTPEGFQAATR